MKKKKCKNISSFLLKKIYLFDIVIKIIIGGNKYENCRTMDKSRKI